MRFPGGALLLVFEVFRREPSGAHEGRLLWGMSADRPPLRRVSLSHTVKLPRLSASRSFVAAAQAAVARMG